MTKKDRDQMLLSMIQEYPGHFLEKHPRHPRDKSIVDEIIKKYGMHPRKIYREKRVAIRALENARKEGREKVNIDDIALGREKEVESRFEKSISLTRLDRMLRKVDPALANRVMRIVEKGEK